MKYFLISEEQFRKIEVLVWGAKFTSAPEMEEYQKVLNKVRTQELPIPDDEK